MRAGISDYYLFLFVALIPWLFFATSISAGAGCVLVQKEMVKKIYFPREVLPIAHVTCQLVNMLLTFIVVFAVLILSGKGLNPAALLYLPIIAKRIRNEEAVLEAGLPGYREYEKKVRYRILPGIW